jgi:autotransporter-associated beta strand protein
LHLGFVGLQPHFGFWGNDTDGPALNTSSYPGNWFQITFRYNPNVNGGEQDIFINGGDGNTAGDGSTYAAGTNKGAYGQVRTLMIGRMIGGNNGSQNVYGALGGALSDVRVYGTALTNAQIALMAAPSGTVYDWNNASATDWTSSASWTSTYAQPGPAGWGIADVAEFGVKQTLATNATVNLNGMQQIAQLITANANNWTLGSGSAAGTNASPLELRQISQRGAGMLTITAGVMIDDTNLLTFDSTTSGAVNVAGPIFNTAAAVSKTSAGTLNLGGANTYGGGTTINSGTLRIAAPTVVSGGVIFSSPIGPGTLTLAGGTTLQDDGSSRTLANNVAINGNVTFSSASSGGLTIDAAGVSPATNVTLTNNPTLTVTNTTTINSVVAGVGQSLTKAGAGTLVLGGANTYNGTTTASAGTLRTTATGMLSSGPLMINAANGVTTAVNLGSNQTVSSLSGSGSGTASLTIAANTTLTVNQSGATTLAATVINSGTLRKSGGGALELDAAPTLNTGSAIQIQAGGGTLRFNVASASPAPTIGSNVTATIATGATLELAGTVPSLANGTSRVNITNNSQAAIGGLLASGTAQQVGGIDGTGNVVVGASAALTANHISQSALIIGAGGTFTLDPSDSSGNPLVAAATMLGAGSSAIAASSSSESSPLSLLSAAQPASMQISPLSSLSLAGSSDAAPILNLAAGSSATASVPEPSSLLLVVIAAAIALSQFRRTLPQRAVPRHPRLALRLTAAARR